ncbi:nuclear transport factor 2 family protein [Saccharopolyspora taberi]|uniref:Nuclear transport factor 2 family protein n=1 Tax=Saccharopolyspora taberi TaxID=60895 RepID=A0ABN3VC19_9PSEU
MTELLGVLEDFYAAEAAYLAAGGPGKADFGDFAGYFHPDVVLHQDPGLPYGGTWRGRDGIERFMSEMSRTWERFEFGEQDQWPGESTVVVRTQVSARARATGTELEFPILQHIAFRDRQLLEVRPFYWDVTAIAAACSR